MAEAAVKGSVTARVIAKKDIYTKIGGKVEIRIRKGMKDAIEHLILVTRELIATPYPPASSSGHPPHMRTGDLARSIKVGTIKREGNTITGGIKIEGVDYALMLEYGTSRFAPRPYFRPALVIAKAEMVSILKRRFVRIS